MATSHGKPLSKPSAGSGNNNQGMGTNKKPTPRAWGPSSGSGPPGGGAWRPGMPPSNNGNGSVSPHPAPPATLPPPSLSAPPANSGVDEKAILKAMHERFVWLVMGLVGANVIATTKAGGRFSGILSAAATEGDLCITLKRVVDLSLPASASVKPALAILSKDLAEVYAADLDIAERNSIAPPKDGHGVAQFRTDSETTSRHGGPASREKPLQSWGGVTNDDGNELGDLEDTLFPKSSNANNKRAFDKPWDQFEANEKLFGAKTDFDEEIYTTKLDRSGKDFKEREKKAEALAREILGGSSANSHVREERGQAVEDSGMNEEDKYGAVVRKEGSYIPPGARRAAAAAGGGGSVKSALPFAGTKVNGASPGNPASAAPPGASTLPHPANNSAAVVGLHPSTQNHAYNPSGQKDPYIKIAPVAVATTLPFTAPKASASTAKLTSPVPAFKGTPAVNVPNAQPQGPIPPGVAAFISFVSNEKERLTARKRDLLHKDMEERLADFRNFSANFKVPTPVPADLQAIIGDRKAKQNTPTPNNKQKTTSSASTSPQLPMNHVAADGSKRTVAIAAIPPFRPRNAAASTAMSVSNSANHAAVSAIPPVVSPPKRDAMSRYAMLPQIPPFKSGSNKPPTPQNVDTTPDRQQPVASSSKMSLKPAPFNPAAKTFTPTTGNSDAPSPTLEANPFFGNKPLKRGSSSMHVKEDFTPFKSRQVPDPSMVNAFWHFTGRSYRIAFGGNLPGGQHHMAHSMHGHMPMGMLPGGMEDEAGVTNPTVGGFVAPGAMPPHHQPPQYPTMAGPPQQAFAMYHQYPTGGGVPFRGHMHPGAPHPQHMQHMQGQVNNGPGGGGPPMGSPFNGPHAYPGQMTFGPPMGPGGHMQTQAGPHVNGQGVTNGVPTLYSPQMQHLGAPQGQPGMYPPQMFPTGQPTRGPTMPQPIPGHNPTGPQLYAYQPQMPHHYGGGGGGGGGGTPQQIQAPIPPPQGQ